MAHQECHDVGSWVNENIQQQVEQCMEQDCIWWCLCCNKWVCGLVWVIVNVLTWVVQTVCEIVADVIDLLVGIFTGLGDIIVGIFTGNWDLALGGLIEIGVAIGEFILNVVAIATLGTLVGTFKDSANTWSLRNYARHLLTSKYQDQPETLASILDAVGITSGSFGLRLQGRALRTFISSNFPSDRGGPPNLMIWVKDGFDLKSIAGFHPPAWWKSSWPELLGNDGESISEADLDNYIAHDGRGEDVKQFTIFSMSSSDFQTRLDAVGGHASELGLVLRWNNQDVLLEQSNQVLMEVGSFPTLLTSPPFSRHNSSDAATAQAELCTPMVIGTFGFTDSSINGWSAHLADSTCLEAEPDGSTDFPPDRITGAAFRDRRPDTIFKYTAIHELGHTFGLCHVDGLFRIMYTAAAGEQKSIWSWSSLWQYWTAGVEAGFTLDEGKKVWDYIVANFSADCLKTRPF